MSETTKGGNIILRDVRVPDSVAPGEAFDVEVDVSNDAKFINPFDPDKCGIDPEGYKIEVVIEHGAETRVKGPDCITMAVIGSKDKTYRATFTAPYVSGPSEVSAHVRMVGSGKQTREMEAATTVTEGAPSQPTDPGGNDSGGGGIDWPGGDGGSGNPLDGLDDAAMALVIIAFLLVAAKMSDAVGGSS